MLRHIIAPHPFVYITLWSCNSLYISVYKVNADAVVQYGLWKLALPSATTLPSLLRSLTPNLLGHLARRGIRCSLLRSNQSHHLRGCTDINSLMYRHRRQRAQKSGARTSRSTCRTSRALTSRDDVAFWCTSTRKRERVHARTHRR